jgi:hypothetical protein
MDSGAAWGVAGTNVTRKGTQEIRVIKRSRRVLKRLILSIYPSFPPDYESPLY